MKIAGLEEAGKGPCIGPLVVCGVMVDEKKQLDLKLLGVKDSKQLTEIRRTILAEKIKEITGEIEIIKVLPDEIDSAIFSETSNLLLLEIDKMALIIDKLKPDKAIIDCPSTNIKQFVADLRSRLKHKEVEIVAEHKADVNHAVVSACSIIAKVTRDNEIEKLKEKYNVDFGSGYTSDPLTQDFLKNNWEKPEYSEIIRKSWESWQRLKRGKNQKKLLEW
jgi:ribonuclease HII